MPTLEDYLREVLSAHGGTGLCPAPRQPDRLVAVHRRIARRRRARVATAAAVVVLMAAAVPAAMAIGRRDGGGEVVTAGPVVPTTSAPAAVTLPEYSTGFRRVAQRMVRVPDETEFEVTYTPRVWTFSVDADCRTNAAAQLTVSVKGAPKGFGGLIGIECGSPGGWRGGLPHFRVAEPRYREEGWTRHGVRLGQPVTFVVQIGTVIGIGIGIGDGTMIPASTHGTAAFGVYEEVPFDRYPLPPRPDKLVDLDSLTAMPFLGSTVPGAPTLIGVLDSRTLGAPTGTFTLRLRLPEHLRCMVDSVAPGDLRFAVAGRPELGVTFWDWNGFASDAGPANDDPKSVRSAVGDTVTITVVAKHYTDPAWRVRCYAAKM